MAYKIQSSFSTGELDPALQERTTFEKYKAGLKTARNVIVGKTGRLLSRFGSVHFTQAHSAHDEELSLLFSPPNTKYLIEFGVATYAVHNLETGVTTSLSHGISGITVDNLRTLHFTFDEVGFYVFRKAADSSFTPYYRCFYDVTIPTTAVNIILPVQAAGVTSVAETGSGYKVEYMITVEVNGIESIARFYTTVSTLLPISASEENTYSVQYNSATADTNTYGALRLYRRPASGGAYGFIGSTQEWTQISGTQKQWTFTDTGQEADYTHTPPDYLYDFANGNSSAYSSSTLPSYAFANGYSARTGIRYQQRLVIAENRVNKGIHASRPHKTWNVFTRDFPLSNASSLSFRMAGEGDTRVLRFMDAGSLVAFTTDGVFSNDPGPLSISNIAMGKRGDWVIDENLPPLIIPRAILFYDTLSKSVISANYSYENASFIGDEISIFSNHLIEGKRIVSWAYWPGIIPVILAVLDDGSMITVTYQREQEMNAWTHSDTFGGLYENVAVATLPDGTSRAFATVNRDGTRHIEYFSERYVTDYKTFNGMDSSVIYNGQMSQAIDVAANTPDEWDGLLTLTGPSATFANTAGNGAVGTIFKYFAQNGEGIELEVTSYVDTDEVIVQPSITFPENEIQDITIYKTKNIITGLSHLNGYEVSVRVDGFNEASPLNVLPDTDFNNYLVDSGQITLENDLHGAIVIVGLPIVCDIETLDVDTVEQQPTLLESRNVDRLTIKVHNSKGAYVGNTFPEGDTNEDMEPFEYREETDEDYLANAPQLPYNRRIELSLPGDWESKGRVAIRHVDPDPLEILSIIPDLDIFRKG